MFLTELIVSRGPPGKWIVAEPLVWADETYGRLEVPIGIVTDLASVPWVTTAFGWFDRNGQSRRPAVLHDWLYQDGTRGKLFADSLLRAALVAEGVPAPVAWAYYQAVKQFGGTSWRSWRRGQ